MTSQFKSIKYLIDGTNICRSYDSETQKQKKARLDILLVLLINLLQKGNSFFCYFDASFRHIEGIKNNKDYDKLLSHTSFFKEVTGGIEADEFILQDADRKQLPIISNDRYKKFESRYPWLLDRKTIKGLVAEGELKVPRLHIHAPLTQSSKEYMATLMDLLNNSLQNTTAPNANDTPVVDDERFFSDKETAKTPTVQSLTEELTWAQKMVKKLEKNIQKRYDEAE